MTEEEAEAFYRALGDRTVRYGERPLDPGRRVAIEVTPAYCATKPGQAALLVTTELLSRMVRSVTLAFPDQLFHSSFGGPFQGSLHARLIERMLAVAPPGNFVAGQSSPDDFVLKLGADGFPWTAHGADWSVYIGSSPSPLPNALTDNIFGSSLAAIAAVAHIFGGPFPAVIEPRVADIFSMKSSIGTKPRFAPAGTDLGSLWFVGCGSVGSAIAYFLALAGYRFTATLFDMDIVKIENLDRSPIFTFSDRGKAKVEVVAAFLRSFGIDVQFERCALADSAIWKGRDTGVPDVLIAAANEQNVRFEIESQFPCIQIYGTTGKQWQSNLFRHLPPEPCSCCAFPPAHRPTDCATGEAPSPTEPEKSVDAALPFLSFGAGLLAAAEISKLTMPGYPFSDNRAFFTPLAEQILYTKSFGRRADCFCSDRNQQVHRRMVAGSKYESLHVLAEH